MANGSYWEAPTKRNRAGTPDFFNALYPTVPYAYIMWLTCQFIYHFIYTGTQCVEVEDEIEKAMKLRVF